MWHLLLVGLVIAVSCFALTWAVSVKRNNYGFLDVAWSYGVLVLAPIYSLIGPAAAWPKWVFTVVGALWSFRLGTYILSRVLRNHPKEDARYATLRKQWPGPLPFLAFFELQALIVVLFSFPFLCVAFDQHLSFTPIRAAALALGIVALIGEAASDWQMQRFKKDPQNVGKVCRIGLWRYSRHPNYFFEALIWWAFFFYAVSSPFGWVSLLCPMLMIFFLFQVTGIPLTEEYAIKSKGEAYKEYQRTTSPFFPWFPRDPKSKK
jgi:steroid 5-alpha reductase family enzyme